MREKVPKVRQEAESESSPATQEFSPTEKMFLGISEKLRRLREEAADADDERHRFIEALDSLDLSQEAVDAEEKLDEILTAIHQVVKQTNASAGRVALEAGLFETFPKEYGVATFEDLSNPDFDLDAERLRRESEVVRENLMRAALADCASAEDLKSVEVTFPPERWGTKDFLEFSNRYRLLDSPDDEIRLFEHPSAAHFREVPRAVEFYALALIKKGRAADAIAVCDNLIKRGHGNGLVWSIRGDAFRSRADEMKKIAEGVHGSVSGSESIYALENEKNQAVGDISQEQEITPDQARDLRIEFQREAGESYCTGLKESGSSFPALEWMMHTIQRRGDLLVERQALLDRMHSGETIQNGHEMILQMGQEIESLERRISNQQVLVELALQKEGADESLDYWKHAGRLELAFMQGKTFEEVKPILAQMFKTADAIFKFDNTLDRLMRVREQFLQEMALQQSPEEGGEDMRAILEYMNKAIEELEKGKQRFASVKGKKGKDNKAGALNEEYRAIIEMKPQNGLEQYKRNTINFLTLLGSITPQYIPGGIGRAGARVPDIMINRQDQGVFKRIVDELGIEGESEQVAIKDALEDFVRNHLGIDGLQNLKDASHYEFDTLSDGLVALSGIEPEMRRNTRSITNLSGSLLVGVGDCRETCYGMGALFGARQYRDVEGGKKEKGIIAALACMEADDQECFNKITKESIPEVLRYNLRGEHAGVYVASIAMNEKYDVKTVSPDDPTALYRSYDANAVKRGEALTRYELEYGIVRVVYKDGTVRFIEPKDPESGRWRPLEHIPQEGGGGVPIVPDLENVQDLEVLNLVEDHTYTTLLDKKTGRITLADAFYDGRRGGPYDFGSGTYDPEDIVRNNGLVRANTRTLAYPDGTVTKSQVYLRALPYSKTDYQPSLGEGDMPSRIRIGGRSFKMDVFEELGRLEKGESVVPAAMRRIREWEEARQQKSKKI
ncbi:MAG: hypothetical protein AAB533_00010 [Patescibacteria group bacterium]